MLTSNLRPDSELTLSIARDSSSVESRLRISASATSIAESGEGTSQDAAESFSACDIKGKRVGCDFLAEL